MSAHTPGPWKATPPHGAYIEWGVDSAEWGIATCADGLPEGEMEANARLIAAAPTMYAYIEKSAKLGCTDAQDLLESIRAGS